MNENLSLHGLFLLCKRRGLSIFLTTTFMVTIACLFMFYLLEPKYEYSKQIMVGELSFGEEGKGSALTTANLQLIRSYMDVINSPLVLEMVIQDLRLSQSVSALEDQLSIINNDSSQIVTITVTQSDPVLSEQIVTKIATYSKEMMKTYTNSNSIQLLGNSNKLSKPELVSPKPIIILTIAVFFGLFTGLCVAILRDSSDTTIKSEQQLKQFEPILVGIITTQCFKKLVNDTRQARSEQVDAFQKQVQTG